MKVILIKDDKTLGKAGELVEAKDGYARNFLIPRKIAIEANPENIEVWKKEKAEEERLEKENRKAFKEIKEKIEKSKVKIEAKAGENGRLFGAITSSNIADAIKEQLGIEVDKRKVDLAENIKTEGIKKVDIKLYQDIVATLKVEVESK